jgi:hypothetical protein
MTKEVSLTLHNIYCKRNECQENEAKLRPTTLKCMMNLCEEDWTKNRKSDSKLVDYF